MDKQQDKVTVDHTKCTPCTGLICVGVCPIGVLEPNAKGIPEPTDATSCTQCGVCADLCPTKAISVKPRKGQRER